MIKDLQEEKKKNLMIKVKPDRINELFVWFFFNLRFK
jgi:hypothetical protein